MKLRTCVLFLKCLINLSLLRPFGKIIYDISTVHKDVLSGADLRKLEKLSLKVRKAELDIQFLRNFLAFRLPHASSIYHIHD